jgi:hypothetical protein
VRGYYRGTRSIPPFSKPYIRYQRVILTRLDMPFLAGLKDIEACVSESRRARLTRGF